MDNRPICVNVNVRITTIKRCDIYCSCTTSKTKDKKKKIKIKNKKNKGYTYLSKYVFTFCSLFPAVL